MSYTREQQADQMMGRFLQTLQEISLAIQKQGENDVVLRAGTEKVLQDIGNAMANLAEKSSSDSEASVSIPSSKIDLTEFTGADRTVWPTWEIQARGKAKSCGSDPSVQFYAIFNKLKDNAAKNVTPWVTKSLKDGTASYEGLLKELGRLYNDPAQQAKALSNLKTMRQQELESFANFFPKFERELANAGGTNFDESIKVMFLRTALNSKFSACLPLTKNYSTYEDLVADLQTAAAGIANQDALHGKRANPQHQPQPRLPEPSQNQIDVIPMDWTPTSNNQGRVHNNANQRPRARWVSPEVFAARREANCCLRCGNNKHYQPNCPYRAPINPNNINNNRAVRSIDPALLQAEPEINMENEQIDLSGKE